MNVLLVSQCSKKALSETRRILDQFAERKGERTWQTAITLQGLDTLRKMLKKSARRNTAVACHWIKSGNQSELMWIVGSLRAFNDQGTVPTNTTRRDILRKDDENQWHTIEAVALLASIAGLFHDLGKANVLFQKKLTSRTAPLAEPVRHEWVSLRLFQAFVNGEDDADWLKRLSQVSIADEAETLQRLLPLQDTATISRNPFGRTLSTLKGEIAKVVGWLIVSHHRLPRFNKLDDTGHDTRISEIDDWMLGNGFKASWNSPQYDRKDWTDKDWQQVWQFKHGTPIRSATWRKKAQSLAERALNYPGLFQRNWLHDPFSSHLARLTLMLADHCYSAGPALPASQDAQYGAYANTEIETSSGTRTLKQKLDEHNIGVARNAFRLSKNLPRMRQSLPAITRHKGFKARSTDERFRWQDKAFDLACGIARRTDSQGFFGVNMASTGCGKTFANARIMYGLADEKLGCRFSVALGLRTLTLQTGDALQSRLRLDSDDMAVLIGSLAVRQLHEMRQASLTAREREQLEASLKESPEERSGSASAEALVDDSQYLRYDGTLDDGLLAKWLQMSPQMHRLLSAPVLVSTIDYLMPATEGERGGKQIAPMLRLLTSDLVLDEPDDFDLADLPALCRLVNWAGMLGARVLLSSATLPPALIAALFDAYASGRKVYQAACGDSAAAPGVCCAWFDEFDRAQHDVSDLASFKQAHEQFVLTRIRNLTEKLPPLRKAELLPVACKSRTADDVAAGMAAAIAQGVARLHQQHHQPHEASGKCVSIGLVRMANINSMVAVAQHFLQQVPPENVRIHFCIYHARHPLIVRSNMERVLDEALTRHRPETLWQVPAVKAALERHKEIHQIFIVFATAVAEVGRDHCYDWAIAEPSSMRSLIQLAGRIQRHRQQVPATPNMLILSKNYRALTDDKSFCYTKPGFESKEFPLKSKDLAHILLPEQYQCISAAPRILPRAKLDASGNLVDLEHAHLAEKLFGLNKKIAAHAALWWQHQAHWCFELQRKTPFRSSSKEDEYMLYMEEEGEAPEWRVLSPNGEPAPMENRFKRPEWQPAERVAAWIDNDVQTLLEDIAEHEDMVLPKASRRFAVIRLRELGVGDHWSYQPLLGVYRVLD